MYETCAIYSNLDDNSTQQLQSYAGFYTRILEKLEILLK